MDDLKSGNKDQSNQASQIYHCTASARNHRPDGSQANDALAIKLDQSHQLAQDLVEFNLSAEASIWRRLMRDEALERIDFIEGSSDPSVYIKRFEAGRFGFEPEDEKDLLAVSSAEAIERIGSGEFELARFQAHPPFELRDHARSLLGEIDCVGPAVDTERLVDKAAKHLFQNGMRSGVVEGHGIRWHYQSSLRALGEILTTDDFGRSNLFTGLQAVWGAQVERSPRQVFPADMSDAECAAKGLWREFPGTADQERPSETALYRAVGHAWLDYVAALRDLSQGFNDFAQRCFLEGRVLAVDEFDDRVGLISPTRWKTGIPIGKNYHFAFSRDLPPQWFNTGKGPRGREDRQRVKAATEWLESQYKSLGAAGKPGSKAELLKELRREFNLSQNAADKAWGDASIAGWKKGGRPKAPS